MDKLVNDVFDEYIYKTQTLMVGVLNHTPLSPPEKAALLQSMAETIIVSLIFLAEGDRTFVLDRLQDTFVFAYDKYETLKMDS